MLPSLVPWASPAVSYQAMGRPPPFLPHSHSCWKYSCHLTCKWWCFLTCDIPAPILPASGPRTFLGYLLSCVKYVPENFSKPLCLGWSQVQTWERICLQLYLNTSVSYPPSGFLSCRCFFLSLLCFPSRISFSILLLLNSPGCCSFVIPPTARVLCCVLQVPRWALQTYEPLAPSPETENCWGLRGKRVNNTNYGPRDTMASRVALFCGTHLHSPYAVRSFLSSNLGPQYLSLLCVRTS